MPDGHLMPNCRQKYHSTHCLRNTTINISNKYVQLKTWWKIKFIYTKTSALIKQIETWKNHSGNTISYRLSLNCPKRVSDNQKKKHFFAVFCKKRTWNGEVLLRLRNVNDNRRVLSPFGIERCHCIVSRLEHGFRAIDTLNRSRQFIFD